MVDVLGLTESYLNHEVSYQIQFHIREIFLGVDHPLLLLLRPPPLLLLLLLLLQLLLGLPDELLLGQVEDGLDLRPGEEAVTRTPPAAPLLT